MQGKFVGWFFSIIFFVIGVMNIVLVHPVPGLGYILIAAFYFPPTGEWIKRKFSFALPLVAQIIIGLVILWGTLAVGDLAEILGL